LSASFIPTYDPHPGTVRIKGDTLPRYAANSAFHCFLMQMELIEFTCIGANAGQQAMKSMGLFMMMVEKERPGYSVAFRPLRFSTQTEDPQTMERKMKDITVWRTVLFALQP